MVAVNLKRELMRFQTLEPVYAHSESAYCNARVLDEIRKLIGVEPVLVLVVLRCVVKLCLAGRLKLVQRASAVGRLLRKTGPPGPSVEFGPGHCGSVLFSEVHLSARASLA